MRRSGNVVLVAHHSRARRGRSGVVGIISDRQDEDGRDSVCIDRVHQRSRCPTTERPGNYVVTGDVIWLWNVTDPRHATAVGALTGHTGPILSVAFTPDSHTLASSGQDNVIRLWDLNLDHTIRRICATTRNTLTRQQWDLYVSPQLRYAPPCP